MFKFHISIEQAHDQDVKCLDSGFLQDQQSSIAIASGSRDKLAKIWTKQFEIDGESRDNRFKQFKEFPGHTRYLSAICLVSSGDLSSFNNNKKSSGVPDFVLTGSYDNSIILHPLDAFRASETILMGHSGSITSLKAVKPEVEDATNCVTAALLLSTSMDARAFIWRITAQRTLNSPDRWGFTATQLASLEAHSHGIWAGLWLCVEAPANQQAANQQRQRCLVPLTGSADCTLRCWSETALSVTSSATTSAATLAGNQPISVHGGTVLQAHTDCVRDLVLFERDATTSAPTNEDNDKLVVSCSNDRTIRVWSLQLRFAASNTTPNQRAEELFTCANLIGWQCLHVIEAAHDHFIYSLCRLVDDATVSSSSWQFASGGEDKSVRVWKLSLSSSVTSLSHNLQQVISLPGQSAWSVTALPNGDLAVGGSDCAIHVFTRSAARTANDDAIDTFEALVASSSNCLIEQHQNGDNVTSSLSTGGGGGGSDELSMKNVPGEEILQQKVGTREGQIQLVRSSSGNIMAHQWSMAEGRWICVGNVIGQPGAAEGNNQSGGGGGRSAEFEGRLYDYVFSVDVEEGRPPLRLPYNRGDDPFSRAHEFLQRHELPAGYLDQVAQFIMKNAACGPTGAPLNSQSGGAGAAGGATGFSGQSSEAYVDPYTGTSRYRADQSDSAVAPANPVKPPAFEPIQFAQQFIRFDAVNLDGLMKKLREFNSSVPPGVQFSDQQLQSLTQHLPNSSSVSKTTTDATNELSELFRLVSSKLSASSNWPTEKQFPLLDICRLLVRNETVHSLASSSASDWLMYVVQVCVSLQATPQLGLFSTLFKLCCNLFHESVAGKFARAEFSFILTRGGESCIVSNLLELTCHANLFRDKRYQIGVASLLLNLAVLLHRQTGGVSSTLNAPVAQLLRLNQRGLQLLLLLNYEGNDEFDPEALYRVVIVLGLAVRPPSSSAAATPANQLLLGENRASAIQSLRSIAKIAVKKQSEQPELEKCARLAKQIVSSV